MVDVTVRGAGAFGLTIAWACVQRGAKVRLVDPNGPASGSSGGLVGALAPHTPENWNEKKAFQFESLIMAQDFWAGVEEASGKSPGYARTGRLQPVLTEHALELARQRGESAKELWEGNATWSVVDAKDYGEWAPKSETGYLIHDTLTARMFPRLAGPSILTALQAKGVEVVTDAPDQGAVVWATGYRGLLEMSEQRGRLVGTGVKGQSALLEFDAALKPQLFADALHIVPHENGTVAIGSTTEREFDDPSSTDELLDEVLTRSFAAFPVLKGARVLDRWAGVRPKTRTRAPMLGEHPYRPGQYVANGGFKIGFGMAPKVAQVMADLVLEGVDEIPDSFRPDASL